MVGLLVLGLFVLSLLLASWKLREVYQRHVEVGSKPWNRYQLGLREDLARSSRAASAEEVRAFQLKEQMYTQRLELQRARGVFADEVERRRAERLEQGRRLEAARVYDALRRE